MNQTRIKHVYEDPSEQGGYRVLVNRLWPRGMKKEYLKYDYWAKELTPSSDLRKWFHGDIPGHWKELAAMYRKEFGTPNKAADSLAWVHPHKTVILLYVSKEPVYNHARILQVFPEDCLKN